MGEVALFYSIFEFPMANGINFKTQFFERNLSFEQFCKHFETKSQDSYAFYQSVEKNINSFKEALSQFVEKHDFVQKWDEMSEKERNNIIYFDEDSYIILRGKLPKEKLISIDWKKLINEVDPKWNKNFSEILELPNELVSPPENRLQALKQKKALIEDGYNKEKVEQIFVSLDINKDLMAKKLLTLVAERTDNLEILCDKLEVSIPYWINYTVDFIKTQEKRLQGGSSSRPKM